MVRRIVFDAEARRLRGAVADALDERGISGGVVFDLTPDMVSRASARFDEVRGSTNSAQAVRAIWRAFVGSS